MDQINMMDMNKISKLGYGKNTKTEKVKHYEFKKTFDYNETIQFDSRSDLELKYEFAKEFARRFVEDDVIQIRTEKSPYDFKTTISAAMNVTEPGINYINVDDYYFLAYGKKWSFKDVEYALEVAFPERLI